MLCLLPARSDCQCGLPFLLTILTPLVAGDLAPCESAGVRMTLDGTWALCLSSMSNVAGALQSCGVVLILSVLRALVLVQKSANRGLLRAGIKVNNMSSTITLALDGFVGTVSLQVPGTLCKKQT